MTCIHLSPGFIPLVRRGFFAPNPGHVFDPSISGGSFAESVS